MRSWKTKGEQRYRDGGVVDWGIMNCIAEEFTLKLRASHNYKFRGLHNTPEIFLFKDL